MRAGVERQRGHWRDKLARHDSETSLTVLTIRRQQSESAGNATGNSNGRVFRASLSCRACARAPSSSSARARLACGRRPPRDELPALVPRRPPQPPPPAGRAGRSCRSAAAGGSGGMVVLAFARELSAPRLRPLLHCGRAGETPIQDARGPPTGGKRVKYCRRGTAVRAAAAPTAWWRSRRRVSRAEGKKKRGGQRKRAGTFTSSPFCLLELSSSNLPAAQEDASPS